MAATEIHPTAVIDPAAELGEGVSVGPYCVISAAAKIGDGCVLHSHVTIEGNTTVGSGNQFYTHAAIGGRSQDLKYDGEPTHLEIGQDNVFREFVTVNRGTSQGAKTVIGSSGNFLAYVHIAHDCIVGDHVILSNNGTLAGHVEMGNHAILGGLTAVHQFCRIGAHAITGGCSKIVQDVPPFMIADGNPAAIRGVNTVGLSRRGFFDHHTRALKGAYKVIYRRNLNAAEAIAELQETHADDPVGHPVNVLIRFIETSQRGIIR